MDHRNRLRTARLRSAIEFLSTVPLGTLPPAQSAAPSALASAAGALLSAAPTATEVAPVAASVAAAAQPHGPLIAVGDLVLPIRGKDFRHVTSRGNRESALFKRALLRDGVLDGRIFFSRAKGHPSLVFSVIKYDAAKESELMRDRQGGLLVEGIVGGNVERWNRWKGKSFAPLLHAEHAPCACGQSGLSPLDAAAAAAAALSSSGLSGGGGGGATTASAHPAPEPYDPLALDDPAIDREKHSFKFASEGVIVSVLAFRNERSIKDELNAKFAERHPWLSDWGAGALTLSKIRSLKKLALRVWYERNWEVRRISSPPACCCICCYIVRAYALAQLSTVACACVYFERLVYKKLVNKQNRRLAMATVLLLAFSEA